MDYDEKDPVVERSPIRPVFVVVPSVLSLLVIVVTLLLKATDKVGLSWGWVVFWWVFTLLVSFGLSLIVWLFASIKEQRPEGRQFNTRERCDDLLRKEIRRRTGYMLSDFTETGDSVEGVGWFGAGKQDEQDLIYFHLYRIRRGQFNRYMLGLMNTQMGKEDLVVIVQSPMNFTDIQRLIEENANRLCRNPERRVVRERIFSDELSGRSRVEREQSPLDVAENEDVEEVRS